MPHHDVAVIIVSYNVKSFLHFCLESVKAALNNVSHEIIVVDNQSTDGTLKYLNEVHPSVILIENEDNVGFAAACNQGFAVSDSRYVLFLNPDTIVGEDFYEVCSNLLESDQNIGAVGVRLIDGAGRFLPESKRGFPSIRNSFFKQSGMYLLHPKSAFFNGYYLGHLSESLTHPVDVITGAYLFTRSNVLHEVGGFDEDYFMYGEDIDLCYKISHAGYLIYYTPESTAIHFKGESTRKKSWKYISSFYGSMQIFINKHFKSTHKWWMRLFLALGVIVNSLGFIFKSIWGVIFRPALYSAMISVALYYIAQLWALIYHNDSNHFESNSLLINISIYTAIWVSSLILHHHSGLNKYERPVAALLKGLLVILVVYALLGTSLRSSRAVILLGFIVITVLISLFHWVMRKIQYKNNDESIYISNREERLIHTIRKLKLKATNDSASNRKLYNIKEHSYKSIITEVYKSSGKVLPYFWDPDRHMLIHSKSKSTQGISQEYQRLFSITQPQHRFLKRAFDLLGALFILITLPIWSIMFETNLKIWKNLKSIISGKSSLIAYPNTEELPIINKGYWHKSTDLSYEEQLLQIKEYAMHYSVWKDVSLFIRHFKSIIAYLADNNDH